MRIALITSYYEEKYRGNEYYLAKFLAAKGHEVFIYVSQYSIPRYGKCKRVSTGTELKNVHVVRLKSVGLRKQGMNYLIGLRKRLPKDQIDVVHVQEWVMPLVVSCLGFDNVVLTQRITKYPLLLKLFVKTIGRLFLRKARVVTALTTESRDELKKYTSVDAKIIQNGVDTALFSPQTKQKKLFSVLYVGRLSKEKGVEQLIDACGGLTMPYHLTIVGSGPEKKSLISAIKKNHMVENVTMREFVDHEKLPVIYSAADVLVVPSLVEPFGFVTIEALSCGIPVIGTNVGGMKDIITSDVGIKIKPGNVDELKEALERMSRSHKSLAKNCRKYAVDHYSWEKIVDKYLNVYGLR